MILNNYWNLFAYTSTVVLTSEGNCPMGLIAIDNNSEPNYTWPGDTLTPWSLRSNLSARIGTGLTAPALTDYCLDTDVTSSISFYNVSINTAYTNGQLLTTITVSGQNNTGNTLTLTEIGITKSMRFNNGARYYTNEALLVRELLDEPVEVPSGEGFTINFEWAES